MYKSLYTHWRFNDTDGFKWTLLDRFSWFLYNVTNLLSIAISVIYWFALFTPGRRFRFADGYFTRRFNGHIFH